MLSTDCVNVYQHQSFADPNKILLRKRKTSMRLEAMYRPILVSCF